jgi:uncharacterized protein DUF5309
MAAVAGLRATGDFGTDERPKDFREMIMFRNPKGTAPIFALSARAKKRAVTDPEFAWWDEPNGNVRLQVNGSHAASTTIINVDSSDPDGTNADRQWGLATHLKQGDLLQVEKTEVAGYDNEFIEVVSVISSSQFTAKRGVAGSTAATIDDDSFLTLMGSAYAEGTDAPPATTRNPIKFYNYTQIFKDTYELTKTVDKTKARTGDAWSNDKKRKTFDHASRMEWAMLYGKRYETTGDNGKPKRYMGGLRSFIPTSRTTIFSVAVTVNTFLDAIYKVFDYDTGAGDERIAFCGNGALNALNKIVQADANSEINYDGPVEVFGMNFRKFVLPQGTIYLKTHPLMNQHGRYDKSMFVLDFDSIRYVYLKDRDTKPKDDVQSDSEDVRRGFLQTEASIQVDRGGLTMAYLGNITN